MSVPLRWLGWGAFWGVLAWALACGLGHLLLGAGGGGPFAFGTPGGLLRLVAGLLVILLSARIAWLLADGGRRGDR